MSEERYHELMDEALDLGHGPARIAILEEAIREADALSDVDLGYQARTELIESAEFAGAKEKGLVAFSWCIAQTDADPDRFPEEDILWEYKWILGSVTGFPQISRQQIDRLQDDMESRVSRLGYSLRPVWYTKWKNLMWMGRYEEAEPFVAKWKTARRDWLADCPACERDSHIEWLVANGKDAQAIKQASPILNGKLKCSEIPHLTLASILRPLLRLGRLEQAQACHKKGYRLVSRNREFVGGVADHLLYLVRAGDTARALKLFEKHLPWAVETAHLNNRFKFYGASELLFEKLATGTKRRRKLRLPEKLSCFREDDRYAPAELAEWFQRETRELVVRFNERNGTDLYSRQIEQDRELAGLPLA